MGPGFIVAVVGAESTGKTALAAGLAAALRSRGHDAVVVGEYLREFCDGAGRTPRREEQAAIAAEQTARVAAAASRHAIVVADTTALMIAVYSEQVFGDSTLYAEALAAHRRSGLTLLTALDLAWEADGLQRDGAHVRGPVDAKVRAALDRAALAYSVVSGIGGDRLTAALAAVERVLDPPRPAGGEQRWQWHCERCGDAACERHLPR